jgi:hypothetical protein
MATMLWFIVGDKDQPATILPGVGRFGLRSGVRGDRQPTPNTA